MEVVDKRTVDGKRRKKEEKRRKVKEERKNRLKEKANQLAITKGTAVRLDTDKTKQKQKETQIERKMNDANIEQIDDEVMA